MAPLSVAAHILWCPTDKENDLTDTTHTYSDQINHALAYAGVHHAGDVRKGTRVPYITHPANLAIILARYDRDDDTLVAAILHDVVEDCGAHSRAEHERQIEEKFGASVLRDVLAVTKDSHDADGRELSSAENKVRYLEGLARASDRARWVCAADKLHNARAILSDLRRAGDAVWSRFNVGRAETVKWYRDVYERLRELGFEGAIMGELEEAVRAMEAAGARRS
jgi:(p)ppGpp synthase/HD superfamily hydrolase